MIRGILGLCDMGVLIEVEHLEQIQYRATKVIPKIAQLSNHERLKYLNLTTLQLRRHRGDLIEAVKIHKELEGIPSNSLFN